MLIRVLQRAIELLEKENAALRAGNWMLDVAHTDRKNVVLFELEHVGRSLGRVDERTRGLIVTLRDRLAENKALLGVKLEAAREVTRLFEELATEEMSDGTYQMPAPMKGGR